MRTQEASNILYWMEASELRFPTSDGRLKKEEALRKIPKDNDGAVLSDIIEGYYSICRRLSPGP